MNAPAVAIFGSEDDPQVVSVAAAASRLGAEVRTVRLSAHELSGWTWSRDGIHLADGYVLDRCRSIYVRSVPAPVAEHHQPVVLPHEEDQWLRTTDARRAEHGVTRSVHAALGERGVAMVNPLECSWFHRSKPAADARLAASGVTVPAGLVSQDRDEIVDFIDRHGDVVAKPVAGGGACRAVSVADLYGARGHTLATAPVFFQQRVGGRNLRIYTVDDRVAGACVIHSDALDYRGNETGIDRIEPDTEVAELAVRAAAALRMTFAGIDIKDADGHLAVLDVNPSPMFDAISRRTGLPVAAALARRLVDGPPR